LVPYCHFSNEKEATVSLKYWEIIADNLSKAGWSWGCVPAVGSSRRTIFVPDAHGEILLIDQRAGV